MKSPLHCMPRNGTAAIAARYCLRSDTVKHFGLHDALHPYVSTGTVIPIVFQGATVAKRFKHDPANAECRGVKVYWLGAGRFDVYNLDVVRRGEPVMLAAGEPDTWVLQQAGLAAVSFLKGEGCVPPEAVRLLGESRPSMVSIVYDLDEAGRAGADKACWALQDVGLAAEILELPDCVGCKGDVADLYRMLGYDDATLRATLTSLPRRAPVPRPPARCFVHAGRDSGDRPGDAWAACTDWAAILEPHGWQLDSRRGEVERWTRPGKTHGASASVNYGGSGRLYVFSGSAAPFEPWHSYGKFSAYALLNFGGDYRAATRALAEQGYGSRATRNDGRRGDRLPPLEKPVGISLPPLLRPAGVPLSEVRA